MGVRCYVSLGANLGARASTLAQAIQLLQAEEGIVVQRVSRVYETRAIAPEPQPDYLNLVVEIETDCSPRELLAILLTIERQLGRQRPYRYAPRTIDLDLLLYGDLQLQTPELTLPHPRMLERQFVLQPLADLAPDLQVGDSPPISQLVRRDDPDVRLAGELAILAAQETAGTKQ